MTIKDANLFRFQTFISKVDRFSRSCKILKLQKYWIIFQVGIKLGKIDRDCCETTTLIDFFFFFSKTEECEQCQEELPKSRRKFRTTFDLNLPVDFLVRNV